MNILNMLMAFILLHWSDILVIVLFIAGMGIMWRLGYKREVKKTILNLVARAEDELGGGSGPIKYKRVRTWLYAGIPSILKIFVTEAMIDEIIEYGFQELKKFFDDGGDLKSYSQERS